VHRGKLQTRRSVCGISLSTGSMCARGIKAPAASKCAGSWRVRDHLDQQEVQDQRCFQCHSGEGSPIHHHMIGRQAGCAQHQHCPQQQQGSQRLKKQELQQHGPFPLAEPQLRTKRDQSCAQDQSECARSVCAHGIDLLCGISVIVPGV
jgi:hypothetical protein